MHIHLECRGHDLRYRKAIVRAINREVFRRLWRYAVVFFATGAILVAASASTSLDSSARFMAIVCVMTGVYYAFYPWFLVRSRARTLNGPGSEPVVTEFADEGLRILAKDGQVARNWAVISGAEERGPILILRSGKLPVVIIERECTSPENYAELRAFVAARGLLPPISV